MKFQDQHESRRKAWLFEQQDDDAASNALEWVIIVVCGLGIVVEIFLGV